MYIQPIGFGNTITSSSTVPVMNSFLSTTSNNNTIRLSQEHRGRLYQIVNELTDDQLRVFLSNHLQSISNVSSSNQFQHYSRTQLIQQAYAFINNYYSIELEQRLYSMRSNRFQTDYQQQPMYRAPQQPQQQAYPTSYNQQSYYYTPQAIPYNNVSANYRPASTSNISPQIRPLRPNSNSTQHTNIQNQRPQQPRPQAQQQQQQQQQQAQFYPPILPRPQFIAQPSTPATNNNSSPATLSLSANISRYQVPNLAPPPTNISRPPIPTPSLSSSSTTLSITHKNLPFYRPIACMYECYNAFRYDTYRKQFCSRTEFLLSLDACNQLALSHYFDPELDMYKTTKCLLLRLARIDQLPMHDRKYDDHLPPNVNITVNSQNLNNLPTPKPCSRQQTDLIRIGREVDITPYCMFNPMLVNEIIITWSYRPDNTNLHLQYANAQFALHVFLVEHLTIEDLCEQIKAKQARFYREDFVKLLAKVIANDRDLGLEVSDQKLKLKCPIDQRRLTIPIRAVTCQHIQCFDLKNYIVLNEKAAKWICPVCNKPALFDDLQIDSYTESILSSIENENITEITIDSNLQWKPVISSSLNTQYQQISSNIDDIVLDDDHIDQNENDYDSKSNIRLIPSSAKGSANVIFLDD